MTHVQHTPGPWKHEGFTTVFAPDGLSVAHTVPHHQGKEEAQANARLIAAAPETAAERDHLKETNAALLSALQALRAEYISTVERAVEIMGELGRTCDPAQSMIDHMERLTGTSAAITKAGGKP